MDTVKSMKLETFLFRTEITLICFNINRVITHLRNYSREKGQSSEENRVRFIEAIQSSRYLMLFLKNAYLSWI